LLKNGNRVVLTGSGAREKEKISRFRRAVPESIDLCQHLEWKEFVEIIANARLLIVSDSVAAHVATAVSTPTIVIGHGMTNQYLWRPSNPRSKVLMHSVQCAPCYRNSGCSSMACVRQLDPLLVLSEAEKIAPLTLGD
jgi:ADP-heptose:LPS heptosyltransferase